MEIEANTFDFQALKSTKRAHLLEELNGLFREFNHIVYTIQNRSKHINEELSTLSERTQTVVETVSSDNAIMVSHFREYENGLANNCFIELQTVREKASDLMKERQKCFDSRIADITIPMCVANANDDAVSSDDYEKLRSDKQAQLTRIQEMHYAKSVESKKFGEEFGLNGTSASQTQPAVIRTHLKEEIRKYQGLLSKLEHSRYESLTSIDELLKDDIQKDLSTDKAEALACVRMLRNKLHTMDLHNDIRLRRLSSQAADCRRKLKDTFLIISKTVALFQNQAPDRHYSLDSDSIEFNTS